MTDRHRTRRRTLRPDVPDLVDLAAGLRDSATIAARAEARVADFLTLTVPTWRSRFPHGLGFTFQDPALHVWGVDGADVEQSQGSLDNAARALFSRGFALVIFHGHGRNQKLGCSCKRREL